MEKDKRFRQDTSSLYRVTFSTAGLRLWCKLHNSSWLEAFNSG